MRRLIPLAVLAATSNIALADLNGFAPSSFTYNQSDARTPASLVPGGIRITDGGPFEHRSVWFNQRQDISAGFTASFTYRLANFTPSGANQGIAFVIQNSAAGTGWVSSGANPTNVGYAGLANSAAITLETSSGPGLTHSGFYTNGATGGSSPAVLPVNAFNLTEIFVTISYDGSSILTLNMNDGAGDHVMPERQILVGSISAAIGSSSAWIGFVADSAGGTDQYLTNFSFTAVPAPSVAGVFGLAGLTLARRRR